MTDLIYIIAWFILPLIPAFILFKFLPSTGKVESKGKGGGPLKGMGLKFGGAFAEYLVLFLVSYNVMDERMKKKEDLKDSKEVWTIKGGIESSDNKFNVVEEEAGFKIDPEDQVIRKSDFDVSVIATDNGKGFLKFPKVDLITTNYEDGALPDLDFDKIKRNIDTSNYVIENFESKIIKLKKPVKLLLRVNTIPSTTLLVGETLTVDTAFSHN